jgi:hypothetical protein
MAVQQALLTWSYQESGNRRIRLSRRVQWSKMPDFIRAPKFG